MRLAKTVLLVLPLAWASPALADRQCRDQPAPVKAYLKAHPGWYIATYDDLLDGDRQNWKEPEKCPGMAAVDLEGNHRTYHALSLLRKQGQERLSRLVLLSPAGVSPAERALEKDRVIPAKPYAGNGPVAIEAAPAGKYEDFKAEVAAGGSRKLRDMPRPVIWAHNLNNSSWVYFMQSGKLQEMTTFE